MRLESTGGGSTLSLVVSAVEVSIRTFLVAALGIAIVILFSKRSVVGDNSVPTPGKTSQLPTEFDEPVEKQNLAKAGGKLIGGAVVSGAVLAFILAVFVALLVTSVTNFLK